MRGYFAVVCVLFVLFHQTPPATARQTATSMQTGYARLVPDAQSSAPAGVAIFGMQNNGVLTTEAGVSFATTIQCGRIFAEVDTGVSTGLAVANPSVNDVTIAYYLTDVTGRSSDSGSFTVPAQHQISAFLPNPPFSIASPFVGTLTFNSSGPVSAVGLRSFVNERGDVLLTTVPVMPLGQSLGGASLLIPYAVNASSLTMQVMLVNPGDTTLSGTVTFYGKGTKVGTLRPTKVVVNGVSSSNVNYSIPPRSVFQLKPQTATNAPLVESLGVTPVTLSEAPSAFAILAYHNAGVTVSMSSVAAPVASAAVRIYAETSGVFGQVGSLETVLSIANPSATRVTARMEVTNSDGTPAGLATSVDVPANGELSKLVTDFFPKLPVGFRGVLRITAPSPVILTAVRDRFNERGDLLSTTTPPYDETSAPLPEMEFPVFVRGGGYSTQLILISTGTAQGGSLYLIAQDGSVLPATSVQSGP